MISQASPDLEQAASAPPSRMRYAVLLVLCSLAFLTYLDRICIMQVQGDIERDLGFAELTAEDEKALRASKKDDDQEARARMANHRAGKRMGLVFSAFLVGYLLFEVPGGWLGDRFGPRAVIVRIVICWSVFTALTGSVRGLAGWFSEAPTVVGLLFTMIAVRFLFGLGEAGAYPNIARALARWFPFKDRASAQGAIWMSSRLGGAVAPAVIGWLAGAKASWGGWQNAFWILGAVGIAWAVFFGLWFRNRPEDDPRANAAERELIRTGSSGPESIYDDREDARVPWRKVLLSRNLLSIYLTAAAVSFSWYFFVTFLPRYLNDHFHLNNQESKFVSGLPLLAGGISCLLGGRLSDWLIRRTGSRRWGRSLPGVVGFTLAGLCAFLVPHLSSASAAIVVLCLASAFQDLAIPCIWSLPADVGGRFTGTVGGCMNTVGGIGGALSPLLAAEVSAATGSWDWVFVMFGATYLLGAALWLRIDASEKMGSDPISRRNGV